MTTRPQPLPLVTLTLIAVNVLLYLVQVANGVHWLTPSAQAMLDWGGNLSGYTLVDQPWRLLTSMFLHIGLPHLALNMYMLVAFGALVERRFGHIRTLLVFLLSGLIGGLVSAHWHTSAFTPTIAAGASGALMGLCGAYLAGWMLARHHDVPHEEIGARGPLVQTIALTLVLGAAIPGVDNASHVGGLVGGFLVGGACALVPRDASRWKRASALTLVAGLALGAIHAGLGVEPSEELVMIKELRAAEKSEEDARDRAEREAQQLARRIADDRRRGPRTVAPEIAAGTAITLPAPVGSLFLMPDRARIAVTGDEDQTLRLVDLATRTTQTIAGRRTATNDDACYGGERCIPNDANAVALAPDGRTAYVASLVTNGVGIVDLPSGKMTGSFQTGNRPRAITLDKHAGRAYILNDGDNTVVAVDLARGKLMGKPVTVSTNRLNQYHPVGLWLSADEKALWVMDESLSRLRIYDAATLAELGEVTVTSGYMNGVHVDRQRGKVWLVGVVAMDLIDMASRKIEATSRFCYGVRAAAVAVDPSRDLMAIAEPGRWVRVVNLRTAATMAAYPYEGQPSGLRFSPDGKQLYLITNGPARLTVFDTGVTGALAPLMQEAPAELLCAPLA